MRPTLLLDGSAAPRGLPEEEHCESPLVQDYPTGGRHWFALLSARGLCGDPQGLDLARARAMGHRGDRRPDQHCVAVAQSLVHWHSNAATVGIKQEFP